MILQTPKVLVLYAHPEPQESVINQRLLQPAYQLPNVTVHDLYACYPDFFIDAHHEQQLLKAHQVVVFQHPLYTYSCPALLKEWFDRVLARGFASGTENQALAGKYWRSVITTGDSELIDRQDATSVIMRPFEMTAQMCQMHWLSPLFVYRARRQPPEEINKIVHDYHDWLAAPLPSGDN